VLHHLSRERLLPIAVTDHSPDPIVIASLPLKLTSLQEVILVFTRIQGQRAQGATNAGDPTIASVTDAVYQPTAALLEHGTSLDRDLDPARAGLDQALRATATHDDGEAGEHLSYGTHADHCAEQEGGR
jgi:hypothetical protein